MKENIIIHRKNNGSVNISIVIDESKFNEVLSSFKNIKHRLISEKEISKYPDLFFDAFRVHDNFDDLTQPFEKVFYVDLTEAKKIWVDQYRGIREQIFKSLDVEYMKALESGDTNKQNEIVSKKKQLRDITDTSKLPDDLDKIKKTWPEILGEMPDYLKFI